MVHNVTSEWQYGGIMEEVSGSLIHNDTFGCGRRNNGSNNYGMMHMWWLANYWNDEWQYMHIEASAKLLYGSFYVK